MYPADGVVEWTRNCYTTMVGPEAELLSTHEGTNQLEIPTSIGDVPFDFGIEFAERRLARRSLRGAVPAERCRSGAPPPAIELWTWLPTFNAPAWDPVLSSPTQAQPG